MGTRITTWEILLNAEDCCSVRLSAQGMTHPRRLQLLSSGIQHIVVCEPAFQRNISPSHLLHAGGSLLTSIFYPKNGGDMFLQNVGSRTDYMPLYLRRWRHSNIQTVSDIWMVILIVSERCLVRRKMSVSLLVQSVLPELSLKPTNISETYLASIIRFSVGKWLRQWLGVWMQCPILIRTPGIKRMVPDWWSELSLSNRN
jgi:hypothetical protein